MASKPKTTKNPRKKTPKKWDGPKDPATEKGSGTYPNQHVKRTRSGHTITMDDSEDNEHVRIQHRSGSAMIFHPDGAVSITTHKGQYNVVFGQSRMTVTGAHDITVKGDGSMRVYGDFNKTVHGDYNMTVTGNHNAVVGGSYNKHVNGNEDKTIGGDKTTKTRGSVVSAASGSQAHTAGDDATFSANRVASIAGGQGLNASTPKTAAFKFGENWDCETGKDHNHTIKGSVCFAPDQDMNLKCGGDYNNECKSHNTTAQQEKVEKASQIHHNGKSPKEAKKAKEVELNKATKTSPGLVVASSSLYHNDLT